NRPGEDPDIEKAFNIISTRLKGPEAAASGIRGIEYRYGQLILKIEEEVWSMTPYDDKRGVVEFLYNTWLGAQRMAGYERPRMRLVKVIGYRSGRGLGTVNWMGGIEVN